MVGVHYFELPHFQTGMNERKIAETVSFGKITGMTTMWRMTFLANLGKICSINTSTLHKVLFSGYRAELERLGQKVSQQQEPMKS